MTEDAVKLNPSDVADPRSPQFFSMSSPALAAHDSVWNAAPPGRGHNWLNESSSPVDHPQRNEPSADGIQSSSAEMDSDGLPSAVNSESTYEVTPIEHTPLPAHQSEGLPAVQAVEHRTGGLSDKAVASLPLHSQANPEAPLLMQSIKLPLGTATTKEDVNLMALDASNSGSDALVSEDSDCKGEQITRYHAQDNATDGVRPIVATIHMSTTASGDVDADFAPDVALLPTQSVWLSRILHHLWLSTCWVCASTLSSKLLFSLSMLLMCYSAYHWVAVQWIYVQSFLTYVSPEVFSRVARGIWGVMSGLTVWGMRGVLSIPRVFTDLNVSPNFDSAVVISSIPLNASIYGIWEVTSAVEHSSSSLFEARMRQMSYGASNLTSDLRMMEDLSGHIQKCGTDPYACRTVQAGAIAVGMRIKSVAIQAKADYEDTRIFYSEALRVAHETIIDVEEMLSLQTRSLLYVLSAQRRANVRTLKNDRLLVLSYISALQSADPAQYTDYHRFIGMAIAHAASIEATQLGDAFGARSWAQRASIKDVSQGHMLISNHREASGAAVRSQQND